MQIQDTKFCRGCETEKPLSDFSRRCKPYQDKPRSRCKACVNGSLSYVYWLSDHPCDCGCGEFTVFDKRTRSKATGPPIDSKPRDFVKGHFKAMIGREWRTKYHEEDLGYETPCWVWDGATDGHGYGQIRGGVDKPHRKFYIEKYGEIPDGLHLDHLCRNRICVNPDHLEAVTCATNIQRGAAAKLTAEKVREIRQRRKESTRLLAKEFGVTECTISSIKGNRSWVDV